MFVAKPTLIQLIINATAFGKRLLAATNSVIAGATKTKITYDANGIVTAGADATTADIADSADRRYVTDAQRTVIINTSGTNTGDQDLSAYATKAYADALIVGLLDDRGNFNASGNVFPSSGGSGTVGAVLKGDLWTVSVAGTLGGTAVTAGDVVRALVDSPGQTAANWAIGENNFGYVALNQAMTSGAIYVGNGSGIGTAVTMSGDVTITNAGVSAIGSAKVTNTMLAGSIAASKLVGTDIATVGTVTAGTWSTGAVIGGATVTLGSDATGDVYYRNSGGVLTRLAIGTTGQVLTVAAGLPSWAAASGGSPGGSTTQVQFNDAGAFGGDSQLTFNKTTGLLSITGAGATGVKILETLPGSGTSYVRFFDNGTVAINSDSGTGSVPLQILYNGTEQFAFSYLGVFAIRSGGALNIGNGLLHVTDSGGVARINTFNELDIRPGGLGGSGTKRVSVVSQNAADQPFRIKGAASQSGNLEQWVSNSDVVYGTISENGYFTTRKVAAPADGELSASELAFWFDDTNGAAKLKIKAKTANGTVVTGEVALV